VSLDRKIDDTRRSVVTTLGVASLKPYPWNKI
jgi:hypothetical protein